MHPSFFPLISLSRCTRHILVLSLFAARRAADPGLAALEARFGGFGAPVRVVDVTEVPSEHGPARALASAGVLRADAKRRHAKQHQQQRAPELQQTVVEW